MRILLCTNDEDLKILKTKSENVKFPISKEDEKILNDMFSYIKKSDNNAVGLSAVQIGHLKRMCAIKYKDFSFKLINPRIISHSNEKVYGAEGCLSVPMEVNDPVERWTEVTVAAYDLITKKHIIVKLSGFIATIVQHEIDHMNGILFTDIIENMKKETK